MNKTTNNTGSSSGRTPDFDSNNTGSNPEPVATVQSVMERISVKIYKDGWVHVRGKYPPNKYSHDDELKFRKSFVSVKMFLAEYGFRILGVSTGRKIYPEIMFMIENEIKNSDMIFRTVLVDFVKASDDHEKLMSDDLIPFDRFIKQ